MLAGGAEVLIGVVQEPVFGPLVVFGLGGAATEVLGDHAARLAPLTDADADELIHAETGPRDRARGRRLRRLHQRGLVARGAHGHR